jgi:3-hydroxyisobutyrate dehydrogenase
MSTTATTKEEAGGTEAGEQHLGGVRGGSRCLIGSSGSLGLDTEKVMETLAGSSVVSAWQAAKLQRIAKDDFSAQFALSLALKDVRLALQAASDDRFAALACLANEWQQVVDQGLGDRDLTLVTLALQRQGGSP